MTSPTELQALLDREGVPMEARAPLRIADSGAWRETECPGSRGTYIELAHVGAMVKWLIGEGYHSIEFDTDDNSVVSLALYDREFSVQPTSGIEATTVLLAMACGRIAKEKDNA